MKICKFVSLQKRFLANENSFPCKFVSLQIRFLANENLQIRFLADSRQISKIPRDSSKIPCSAGIVSVAYQVRHTHVILISVNFWLFLLYHTYFLFSSPFSAFLTSSKKLHQNLSKNQWKEFKNNEFLQICAKKIRNFAENFLKYWGLSGAKACKSCRSRQELSNEYLLAKFGVDT